MSFSKLKEAKLTIIEGDYDVFGDGSVTIISAPGHTPGHQVLLVKLAKTGPVLLSGDLYHFRESRLLRRVPKFNYDAAMSLRSIDAVEVLLDKTVRIAMDRARQGVREHVEKGAGVLRVAQGHAVRRSRTNGISRAVFA